MILVGKRHYLGLDARTVTRAYALDLSVVEWRVGQTATEYLVNLLVGLNCPAWHLLKRLMCLIIKEGELMKIHFSILSFGFAEVDCLAVDAYGCPCFHA